jgi:hypothetical protein
MRLWAAKPSLPRLRPNTALQRSGWIGAILALRRGKTVFPIYRGGTFQPPAERQAVGWQPINTYACTTPKRMVRSKHRTICALHTTYPISCQDSDHETLV